MTVNIGVNKWMNIRDYVNSNCTGLSENTIDRE